MTIPRNLPDVALFAHIVCRPEGEIDLAQAALMLAEPEYPGLDIPRYLRLLDRLASQARDLIASIDRSRPMERAVALVDHLIHDQGFRGNLDHYDDPRNSFLNEVIDRRLGIPITLSVVMTEVARRLGVPLQGVSFPGHFLLRAGVPDEEPRYLDPFTGLDLGQSELREFLFRFTQKRRDPTEDELQVADKHSILLRMLANLRVIYAEKGDVARLTLVNRRMEVLRTRVIKRSGALAN